MSRMNRRCLANLRWGCLLLPVALGCAGLDKPPESVTKECQKRNEKAARQFEAKRDAAEFQAALECFNRHDLSGCQERLERILAGNPSHCHAHLLLADVYLNRNQHQQAFTEVRAALKACPHDARAHYVMALLLDTTGQREGALAYYEKAARLNPDSELYHLGYHTAREAVAQERAAGGPGADSLSGVPEPVLPSQRHKNALPNGRSPVPSAAPEAPAVRHTAHDGEPARTDSIDFAGLPSSSSAHELLRRGQAALAEGRVDVARARFSEAAAACPDSPDMLILAAVASLRYNQPDLALDLLLPVCERFSDSAAVYRIVAVAHYRRQDYRASQLALQQALSLDKSHALSYLLMGYTLAKLGESASAEAHFRQAQTLNPEYTVRR